MEEATPNKHLPNLRSACPKADTETASGAASVVVEAFAEASAAIEAVLEAGAVSASKDAVDLKDEVDLVDEEDIRTDLRLRTRPVDQVVEVVSVEVTRTAETDTVDEEQPAATMTLSVAAIEGMRIVIAIATETKIEIETRTRTAIDTMVAAEEADATTTKAPENDTTKVTGTMILVNAEGIECPLLVICHYQHDRMGGYPTAVSNNSRHGVLRPTPHPRWRGKMPSLSSTCANQIISWIPPNLEQSAKCRPFDARASLDVTCRL